MFSGVTRREIGQYPVSIPTSLLLESLTNIHEELKWPEAPILNYGCILINLKTVFRNMHGSLTTDDKLLVSPDDLSAAIITEMGYISGLLKQYNPDLSVEFYISDYYGLESIYKHAKLRGDTTERQMFYTTLMTATLGMVLKSKALAFPVKIYKNKITDVFPQKTLIMTHYAYDLLSSKKFGSLTLAESHTGKLKGKNDFYTKFENGKELVRIPFCEGFLQIFGDSETFRPLNIKARKVILELADQQHWTQLTTRDKILYDVDKLSDKFLADSIKQMFRS
jgi:hypothetical protein